METRKMLVILALIALIVLPLTDLLAGDGRGNGKRMMPGQRLEKGKRQGRQEKGNGEGRGKIKERLQKYADENGITLEEAKEKFKEKHQGNNKRGNQRNRRKGNAEWKKKAMERRRARIQKYADENGLSFEEALKKLREERRAKIQAMVKKYAEEHGVSIEEARKAVMKELKKKGQERFKDAHKKFQEKRKERKENHGNKGQGKGIPE